MAALGIRNEVKKIGFRRMQRRTHRCFPGISNWARGKSAVLVGIVR